MQWTREQISNLEEICRFNVANDKELAQYFNTTEEEVRDMRGKLSPKIAIGSKGLADGVKKAFADLYLAIQREMGREQMSMIYASCYDCLSSTMIAIESAYGKMLGADD